MSLLYEVPEYKKLRVIIDTDAACEADDPFAIAHALMSKKLDVKAILAEQFGSPETTVLSYREILKVLEAMEISVPVFMGEEGKLSEVEGKDISPAAAFFDRGGSKGGCEAALCTLSGSNYERGKSY